MFSPFSHRRLTTKYLFIFLAVCKILNDKRTSSLKNWLADPSIERDFSLERSVVPLRRRHWPFISIMQCVKSVEEKPFYQFDLLVFFTAALLARTCNQVYAVNKNKIIYHSRRSESESDDSMCCFSLFIQFSIFPLLQCVILSIPSSHPCIVDPPLKVHIDPQSPHLLCKVTREMRQRMRLNMWEDFYEKLHFHSSLKSPLHSTLVLSCPSCVQCMRFEDFLTWHQWCWQHLKSFFSSGDVNWAEGEKESIAMHLKLIFH